MMWRIALFSLLFTFTTCFAANTPVLTIEIAKTQEEQEWGLMGRKKLPPHHGMLFIYQPPQQLNFWMFNTLIDLSIAFIDEQFIIREIYLMQAHPEKMDPKYPVKKLSDIQHYWTWGTTQHYFRTHSITSKGSYPYALEVNAGWFSQHNVRVGDKIILDEKKLEIRFKN